MTNIFFTRSEMNSTPKFIQFGVFTPDDWRAFSACEITTASSRGNLQITGTPYDLRLGALENDEDCGTCGAKNHTCPGHFGHIELPEPCYNPEFIGKVCGIFKCISQPRYEWRS